MTIAIATSWFWVGLCLPAAAQVDIPKLVINEVFYRGKDANLEFVELFNVSDGAVDLSSVLFSDSRRRPVALSDERRALGPGEYAVIIRDAISFDARFSFSARIEVAKWPALNNSGDAAIIWINGSPVDSVVYSTSWGGNDASLERIDPSGSSSARSNWAESLDRLGGTPGRINSVFARDTQPPRMIFCEEIADGILAIDFSEPLSPSTVARSSFRFESGFVAEEVTLDDSRQRVLLTTGRGTAQGLWIAASGISDESGNLLLEQRITIAWLPTPGELRLNEIMYEPLADEFDGLPNQSEYLELVSVTDRSLSIRSAVLTDHLREDGTRDTTHLSDRRFAIEPGAIVLVYARPDLSEDPLAAFPDIDRSAPGLTLLPISSSSLSFRNNGDKIRLERWGGVVIDEVEFAPSWHLTERLNTRGVSLERISVEVPTQEAVNWSSSVDPAGGTPGAYNSIRFEAAERLENTPLVIEPSPFSPDGDGFEDVTVISLSLDRPTAVIRAWVFDLSGRVVIELESARPVGPRSSIIWDGRDQNNTLMKTGVYVILLEAVDVGSGYVARYKKPVSLVQR